MLLISKQILLIENLKYSKTKISGSGSDCTDSHLHYSQEKDACHSSGATQSSTLELVIRQKEREELWVRNFIVIIVGRMGEAG